MNVESLLSLIPEDSLKSLALTTKVDHQVKKLHGHIIFKLLLFSMLNSNKLSLRVMESMLSSAQFKQFSQSDSVDAKFNSIRDRICTINSNFFKELFEEIFKIYNKELKEEKALCKADSTYVSVASKLVSWSMQNGHKGKSKHIKYSLALKGSLPCSVKVFNSKKYISEDLALGELIAESSELESSLVVFDRGLISRKAFEKFSEKDTKFIGRARMNQFCKSPQKNSIPEAPENSSIRITKDVTGKIRGKKMKLTKNKYRIIEGEIVETAEPIAFVTNLLEEDVYHITQLYRNRWEIEVFFKFIKQHLNTSHLISRDKNGIEVVLYMTLITAILIIAYKKLNKIKGYKIAKLKFEIELDQIMIKEIVEICGGDPNKAAHLWNSS